MADSSFPGRSLVLASGNPGKLGELTTMLKPLGWSIQPQSDWTLEEAVEDGLSFIENALIKARHAAHHSNRPALGDDSGLVVDALNGRPGIYSSRYAGPQADDRANIIKLLKALKGVPESKRSAHFYCAMALVRHTDDPSPLLATGMWCGRIMESPAGTGGFGYDPVFWVPAEACSSAELPVDVKNRLSHRGQALRAMTEQMKREFGP